MSLTLALNNALSGLKVNQRSLSVLSHNIANANTQGYSRQVVDQSAVYLDGIGEGVRIEDVRRKVDQYLLRAIQAQNSNVGYADVTKDYAERVQILLGEPGNDNSIDTYIDDFFNTLQDLADSPDLSSMRYNAVSSGIVVARELSTLAYNIEDLRYQADRDVNDSISFINQQLRYVDSVNLALNRAYALGNPVAGLLDQRDMALKDLSGQIDVKYYYKETGEVSIYAGNGISLLDDNLYELAYTPAPSIETFINNRPMNPIYIYRLNEDGTRQEPPQTLVTGGVESEVSSVFSSGKMQGLLNLRDRELPDALAQLDTLSAQLRDTFNAIHNDGSSYPGAEVLTGTRSVYPTDRSQWTGAVRIAVLDEDGNPVPSYYSDESDTGIRPLLLDLSYLDSGFGAGEPSMQTIVDEINHHFGVPNNKAVVNNISNIELVSDSFTIPGFPQQFSFDFELDNISGQDARFFITDIQVFDNTAANITSITQNVPTLSLDPLVTYQTTNGSNTVTITLPPGHGLIQGDYVYLSDPGAAVNGIPNALFNTYYQISNVTATTFDIVMPVPATATGPVGVGGQTATPRYDVIEAGNKERTREQRILTADLTGNPASPYYDFQISVGIQDEDGVINTSILTYRVNNNQQNLLNDRFAVQSVAGNGQIVLPGTTQSAVIARLVDEDGNELPKVNGIYADRPGFLQLMVGDSSHRISIDEMDSIQTGNNNLVPVLQPTNRAFSHFFELNNFFKSNEPIATGDTLTGSAINMAVEDRFIQNANLITMGDLQRSTQPADPTKRPKWTYERAVGDNSVVQRISKLGIEPITFAAAGGLPDAVQSFNGYAGQVLGFAGSQAVAAEAEERDQQILLDGFNERSDSISGVNLDEELANTIIYQNSYTASARVINVTNELFETLLATFQ